VRGHRSLAERGIRETSHRKEPDMTLDRRRFLGTISSASAASFIGPSRLLAQEAPLETTRVRLAKIGGVCIAPQYVANELLRAEGFTDIRFVETTAGIPTTMSLARGEVDFSANYAPTLVIPIDAGEPVTVIGGEHIGCFELFAKEGIRGIADLKGRTVGVQGLASSQYTFLSIMAAHVGLDPAKDINWVTSSSPKPMELFAEGKIDAFLGFPPEPQELRARNIGHVIVNSSVDRPWSQYFCCMLAGNRDFVRRNPVATKRVLRAIIKTTDLCAAQPEKIAQRMVDGGFTAQYDYALRSLKEISYAKWREYDVEDTLRFYSLRLREAGVIKSTPTRIIAQGIDLRFFNQLKRELKG
jgi:NitT/TauT family transport system substrate-binding protein